MAKTNYHFELPMNDVSLITFALRRLSEETGFGSIKEDALALIEHFEEVTKDTDNKD